MDIPLHNFSSAMACFAEDPIAETWRRQAAAMTTAKLKEYLKNSEKWHYGELGESIVIAELKKRGIPVTDYR
jgi:hypothetical protein